MKIFFFVLILIIVNSSQTTLKTMYNGISFSFSEGEWFYKIGHEEFVDNEFNALKLIYDKAPQNILNLLPYKDVNNIEKLSVEDIYPILVNSSKEESFEEWKKEYIVKFNFPKLSVIKLPFITINPVKIMVFTQKFSEKYKNFVLDLLELQNFFKVWKLIYMDPYHGNIVVDKNGDLKILDFGLVVEENIFLEKMKKYLYGRNYIYIPPISINGTRLVNNCYQYKAI